MRRIAYVTPLYFSDDSCVGGGERYPQSLARGVAIASQGKFEVDLISFGRTPSIRAITPGVRLRLLEAARPPRGHLDHVSWELPSTLDEYDLVHVHQSQTRSGEVAVVVAKQLRKPVCITDHGCFESGVGTSYGLTDLVDAIVAYSDFGASLYHTKSTPLHVIKGGVDTTVFTPSDVPLTRDRVLYVGRILPHKGIEQVIRAIHPDIPLTICGRAYHHEYFIHLKSLAVDKNVEFLTDADDDQILSLYRRAFANVLPSVYLDCFGASNAAPELMGFTLLEAMACGTPAISSRVAAMPEFIREGETGFVFDSIEDLSAILLRLAHQPGLADTIGRQARKAMVEDFDVVVAGAKLARLYEALLQPATLSEVA